MSFEELSHTADIRIRVRAPTLELLFADSLDALMQVVYGKNRRDGVVREIRASAPDTESLLMEFLSEVLFVTEVENLVFSRAEIRIEGDQVFANLSGEPFDPARHAGGTEVKGISYSGLSVTRDAKGYMLDILFDV